jgi:mannose-6-phosphate isomerase
MLGPILLEPIAQERVWGGSALATRLGRTLPSNQPIGESWEIVDRPEAQSRIRAGASKGATLRQLIERAGRDVLGPTWPESKPFPILVKWLDCRERLSLQVHPPAAVAAELRGEPKTENWFIAAAEPGACLLAGLKRGVTRHQFEQALRSGEPLEPLVHRMPVRPGDSMFVRSGQIHAIDAGNFILEIQQNSDTTYRVNDWGRLGLDGKPRALHVEQSLRSIDFNHFEPEPLRGHELPGTGEELAHCDEFRLRQWRLGEGATLAFGPREECRIVSLISGNLEVATSDGTEWLVPGDNAILPWCAGVRLRAAPAAHVLVTDRFSRA